MTVQFVHTLTLTLCLLTQSLLAECTQSTRLSLCEAISIALENNPETHIAWWNARRATASIGIAKSAYYPKVDFVASLLNGREFQFLDGPEVNYTTVSGDLTLSMILYDFGRTSASVQETKMALRAANWQADWTLQRVMIRVIENAYATIHAQETLLAYIDSLEDAQKALYAARELNRVGLRSITDVYTSEATVAQLQLDVAQQRALYDIQKGKLAASMGLSADTPFELSRLADLPAPPMDNLCALIAYAKTQRADLMAKQTRVLEALARQDKARANYRPKLSVSGRGGAQHGFNDQTRGAHYDVALHLEVPLFTGFETVYQNRLAFADLQITREERLQLEIDIALEVLTQSRTLEASQEMLSYAASNLQSAVKAYEGVLSKYQAGKEGIAEVSIALRNLSAARVRSSDVQTRHQVSMANLAYATGTLAPYMESHAK